MPTATYDQSVLINCPHRLLVFNPLAQVSLEDDRLWAMLAAHFDVKTPVKVINRKKSAHVCVSVTGQCFCVSFCINECVKVEILLPIIIMTIYK